MKNTHIHDYRIDKVEKDYIQGKTMGELVEYDKIYAVCRLCGKIKVKDTLQNEK